MEIPMDLTFLWNLKNAKSALWQLCLCSRFEQTLFWIPGPDCFLDLYLFYTVQFMLWDRCSCLFFLHFVINKQISASYKVHGVCSLIFFIWLACLQKRNKYLFFKFSVLGVFFQNEWTFLPRLLPFVPQKAQSNSCKDSFPLSSHEV